MKRIIHFLIIFLISFPAFATSRALVIGIGKYDRVKTGWNTIHGDNDVSLLKPWLITRGFTDLVTLTNEEATKTRIVNELKSLAQRSSKGDKIFFLFSGHGQPIRDDNHDEGNGKGYDESIIPYDACRDKLKMDGKYEGQYHLIDDELCPLFDSIKKKLGSNGELFVAVDACYSKGIQKDEYTDLDPDLLRFIRGTDSAFTPPNHSSYLARVPKPNRFTPGAKMYVVTACASDERNFEYKSDSGKMYGSLAYYIYTLLKTDANFSRWERCFNEKDYLKRNIFQVTQHPSIEVYK